MGQAQKVPRLTPAEYLRIERAADFRSEYFDGELFAMAGGSLEHSLISLNIASELRSRLKQKPCTAFESNLRIWIAASNLYTYADAGVFRGEAEFLDERQDTILNPTVIVEVLSESSEAYDRGKKFKHYRRIPSFREYVLVAQDRPLVERYLRNADDTWTLTELSGLDTSLDLPAIEVVVPLEEIYHKIVFRDETYGDV